MRYNSVIKIKQREISIGSPAYFIADIASNHDGSLEKAKELIGLAKEAGADAIKFQHFLADKIVSDYGFKKLGHQIGHQSAWTKSVYETYRACECNRVWSAELAKTANEIGINFMTTPYDAEAIESLDKYISAYKIGSGDITYIDFILEVVKRKKPVFLATGASNMDDVERAVDAVLQYNKKIVLMQCNTNYTGNLKNFKYINLNVLKYFALRYPGMVLGLSDHTPGHATVLGAITLGARVIEKHFTSNNSLVGPDHAFSMNPTSWREMVERSRELEYALGSGIKCIEKNEEDAVIVQRRCIRFKRAMRQGQKITVDDIECLRPTEEGAVLPYQMHEIIGKIVLKDKQRGQAVCFSDLEA